MKATVTASHMYSGIPSYFSGHAVKENEYLAVVILSKGMTLKSFCQQVIDDMNGTDPGKAWYEVPNAEIIRAVRAEYRLSDIRDMTKFMERRNPHREPIEDVVCYVLLRVENASEPNDEPPSDE